MPDNPANRLHYILEGMLKHEPRSTSEETSSVIAAAWPYYGPRTFGEDHHKDSVLYHVFYLQQLMNEVVNWIEGRELDRELFKRPVERLWRGILGVNLNLSWEETKKTLDPADVRSLLFLSREFEKEGERNAQLIDQEEMKDLVAEVDALYDAVKASDMPEDVKTFILEQLAVIKHAIRVYPYQGYDSLQRALQQNIGATMLFSSRLEQVAKQYPEVNRLRVVMGHLSTVLTKASEIATIAEPLKPYIAFLLGSDQPPK
jgi:hypothetical protein